MCIKIIWTFLFLFAWYWIGYSAGWKKGFDEGVKHFKKKYWDDKEQRI